MSEGYIPLFRKITNCWVWQDKPFSKGQAWVDLLLMANHADGKIPLGNELIEVKRGDVITSTVKLSKRWGWSRSKVLAFLSMLEVDIMIEKKSDSKKTALTICNYKYYSDLPNSKKTAKRQRSDTINNVKNEEEEYIPPISPIAGGEKRQDLFSEFWKAYPKKVGKGAAEKSFEKYKPNRQLLDSMLKAVEIQKQSFNWTKDGGQYIPNPTTWLNQKRWLDEVPGATSEVTPSKPKRYKIITDENGKEVSVLDE